MATFARSNYANRRVEVPVVAIFTKFDGLVTATYNELREEFSIRKATNEKVEMAKHKLDKNFIRPLMETRFRPSDHVQLDG